MARTPQRSPQTVLVTGASSGLGLALARRLIADPRFRVALTAREESLPRFAAAGITESDRVRILPLDVTNREQRIAAVARVEHDLGGVDMLVNNAGVSYRAVLEQANERERQRQLDVNFLGPVHLIRLVLPGMRRRRAGRIVNVSSVGGMMAMPTMALYSASKWALEGASEALWYEVRPFGIHVTLVEPGFIHSESFRNTRLTEDSERALHDHDAAYHNHYAAMAPFIERLMQRAWATPETVAAKVHRALTMRNPPLRMLATPDAHAFALLRRWLPRRLYHWYLRRCLPAVRSWGAEG